MSFRGAKSAVRKLMNDTDCPLCNTQQLTQPPLALAVPLSRFTPRVGGGSAFFVRHRHAQSFLICFWFLWLCIREAADLAGCAGRDCDYYFCHRFDIAVMCVHIALGLMEIEAGIKRIELEIAGKQRVFADSEPERAVSEDWTANGRLLKWFDLCFGQFL